MRQVSMVFAEFERKTGAIRTKEGIRGKVATGQYPNHPPYGYKNIEKPGSRYKEIVLDEENAFFCSPSIYYVFKWRFFSYNCF